ncbi:MAG: AraC family transcriptional regulator [Clostridia bacterium]|nr:AraC family transcriptional regulator [Clostridia bacterium]
MKVSELMELIGATNLNPEANLDTEITCGYSCDLLSWVLAHGKAGMAWCTVQTHVNVIAVSVLMEMACVILVEGVEPEPASLKKAIDEEMPILATNKTAYEVCVLMGQAGVLPPAE